MAAELPAPFKKASGRADLQYDFTSDTLKSCVYGSQILEDRNSLICCTRLWRTEHRGNRSALARCLQEVASLLPAFAALLCTRGIND